MTVTFGVVKRIKGAYGTNSVSLIALSRIMATGLTLLTAPIIARSIGPIGRGETATALASFALIPIIISLGMPLEVRRAVAESDGSLVVRSARDICIVSFAPAAIISAALAFSVFSSMPTSVLLTAALGVFLAPLTVSWLCDQSALIARRNFRAVAAIQIAQPACYVSLISFGWVFDCVSVVYVLACNIIGTLVSFALGMWFCRVSLRGSRCSRLVFVKTSMRYYGSSLAEVASNRFDQLLVLPLIGAFGAGLYSIAVTVSSIPLSLGHALGAHFFNVGSRSDNSQLRRLSGFALRAGLLSAGIFSVFLCALVPFLVPMVFGSEFSASVPATLISLLGSVLMTSSYVGSMVLASQGKGSLMTLSQVLSLVAGLVGLYLLAPGLGAVGASVASAVGYLVLFAAVAIALRVRLRDLVPSLTDLRSVVAVLRW
ncbi:oligosaccharide flippase family protein [Rhodococcus jostii]|uniref:oligosaccharide flippase family protein n=1 Tax=Rhodococcus jostii TaxID=132919 RepID=UPI003666FDB1